MIDYQALYITMLTWGAAFNLIAAVCTVLLKNTEQNKRRWMLFMQLSAGALLAAEAVAWLFQGQTGKLAYWLVRVSNYIGFTAIDVILIFFNGYVCSNILPKGQVQRMIRPRLVQILGIIGIIMVAVSQKTHLYYNFDASNYYYRCSGYTIAVLIPMTGLFLDLSMLIQRRRSISSVMFVSMLSYIALPAIATVVQTVTYGYPFICCSVAVSMILMFLGITVEQNRELGQLARCNVETAAKLEIATTLNRCVTELSAGKEVPDSIQKLLEIICQYFSAERTYVFQFNMVQKTLSNTYEYVEGEASSQKENLQNLPLEVISRWMEQFRAEKVYYMPTLEQERGTATYDMLAAQNVDRLLAVPLMKEREIIGFLGVDNPKAHYEDPTLLSSIQFFLSNSLDMQAQQARLRYISSRDMLTKLYNRNRYISMIESTERRPMENIGAAYMDLNGLKEINDRYGHEAGDRMICKAAGVLLKYFDDYAYRVGGDEFIIVYPGVTEDVFLQKIEDVRRNMKERHVSISIGAIWRRRTDDLEEMLKDADQLMYVEKEQFHNYIANRQEGNEV